MKKAIIIAMCVACSVLSAGAVFAGDWVPSGANMYYTGGNIGVGTTTPAAPLHINGSVIGTDLSGYSTRWSFTGSQNGMTAGLVSPNYPYLQGYRDNITAAATAPLLLNPFGGNVGIGTTAPEFTLDINGTSAFRDNLNNKLIWTNARTTASYAGGSAHTQTILTGKTYYQNSTGGIGGWYLNFASPEISGMETPYIYTFENHNMRMGTVDNGYRHAEIEISNIPGRIMFRTGSWQDPSNTPSNPSGVRMTIVSTGNVGIGTMSPQSLLAVNGTITAKEVVVTLTGWADHVFNDDYKLMSLNELEKSIKTEKHLPGIPSADEVKKNGVSIGDMQAKLLQKVEELTLHVIEQNRKLENQNRKLENLQTENETLKKQMTGLQENVKR
ncbi:MAG: hypothetical protein BWK80_59545 [Desulfobacteraceae bacterium IS3]|nr:MAG: hypothetical protein BWK80_59545 [Desulfobacteraceae bacterium IS3]